MKKSYLMLAAAALFAACSSNDLVEEKSPQTTQQTDDGAIIFDAYQSRNTTRAGLTGEMNITQLRKNEANKGGFGVFAYYTDGELYAGTTKPNFMYNQGVFYADPNWSYSPVKYWPNEFGGDAISDQVDRVTFFAYAPYVSVDPLTGVVNGTGEKNTENITGMTRNNATGDPFIKYTGTMDPTNTVDLCYGVAAMNYTSSNSITFPNDIKAGDPYLNLTKPGGDPIKFDFKHSLAKLNVQINNVVNQNAGISSNMKPFTRVWVRSVKFEGITLKGQLNLKDGKWYAIDASGDNEITSGSVTVYDGLKDSKEPVGIAANETPATLNPAIIQSFPYKKEDLTTALNTTDDDVTGVTEALQNLFKFSTGTTDPVFIIPTGEPLKVTVVYDVETYDKNLAYYLSDGVTPGSTVQNSITKTISAFGPMEAGNFYTLKLHLGLRSVEFDAQVHGWDATLEGEADLPWNDNSIAATNPVANASAAIAANTKSYTFRLTGLDASENIIEANQNSELTLNDLSADGNGDADYTATFANKNTTTTNKTYWVSATGETSHKGVKFTITQKAHALELAYASCPSETAIRVSTSSSLDDGFESALTGATITVYDLEDPTTDIFSAIDSTDKMQINLNTDLINGHTYKVTVTANDVTESFTFLKN